MVPSLHLGRKHKKERDDIRVDVFFGKRTLKTTWHPGIRTDLDGSTWWLNRRGEGGAAIVSSASFSV